ncbi:cytochrome c oxidase polypeptide II [Aquipluma nitroreducens]|uniref:Cytochrome c oxidase polypeptide II n=1 Tax=Aquipluma nitroreducens TaxID=2010828 RepID=A0A5K7SFA7_9BACT|nr:c-type cytochrome [Aquipluma nitroreducens]BBE20281.1 cytochrome c oxidase polypeptide II [Aquipluma nitroreducens]
MAKNNLIFLIVFLISGCNSQNRNKLTTKESIQKGETLFATVGCTTCHSLSGETRYGPSLNKILNTEVIVIQRGKEHSIKVDREYIKKSIQDPDFEKLVDFKNKKMPKPTLSSDEIDQITDYLISINSE